MSATVAAQAAVAASRTKTGRTVLIIVLVSVLVVPVALVGVPVALILAATGSASAVSLGGACVGSAPAVKEGQTVDGYGPPQLAIAATIITVGQGKAVDQHGQQVAVMVAMGESSLQNLDHGDAVDNTTIGVFQQGASYGTRAQRLDVATAAGAFYDRMLAVSGWDQMDPSLLGHTVEVNQDANHYTPYWTPAGDVLQALSGGSDASCQVPADAKAAATLLLAAVGTGKLTFLEPRYEKQVQGMADGTATPECVIDAQVLQLMVIAVNNFAHVGASDLNRRCTGETPGAGTASAHWQGKAVDFYALNHQSLTGADALSIQLIRILDPYVPHGSGLGQKQVRAAAGDAVTGLKNFTVQFDDTADHLHVQVP
jgi:hypothetical protein